jgi:hypothetical protein
MKNTHVLVGRMKSFIMLNQMVHIEQLGLSTFNPIFSSALFHRELSEIMREAKLFRK